MRCPTPARPSRRCRGRRSGSSSARWRCLSCRAGRRSAIARRSFVTIALSATAIFVMFTVLHDASHYSISSHALGERRVRARWRCRSCRRYSSFPLFGFIHIEHHRHTNDDEHDPDHFASHGPWWQLPFRLAAMDVCRTRVLPAQPAAPAAGRGARDRGADLGVPSAGSSTAVVTGNLWLLAVVYLIPQRIAMIVLAWWFDWLPHHGLDETQRENRYRATRNRVGLEWLFTPLMLSQNYHLVHHLHPSIPFYRYLRTWRRNEEAYLERDAAISTVFGQSLTPTSSASGSELDSKLCTVLPVRMPKGSSAAARGLPPHAGRLASTRSPTTATRSRSRCPRSCATSSASSPASTSPSAPTSAARGCGATTRSARRRPGRCCGSRSSTSPAAPSRRFVAEQLAGRRRARADDADRPLRHAACTRSTGKHYVAIVVGSGITPILSMLADDARDRDREPVHADLRQPHRAIDDVPRRARRARVALRRPARDPARPLAATRTTPRTWRAHRPRQARALADGRARARRRRRVVPVRPDRAGRPSSATR